jgi:FkbM family methyltransferase
MPDWKDAFQMVFARKELQGMWSRLHSLSTRGLGYGNWNPAANGEFRLIASCAKHCAAAGVDLVFLDVGANEGEFARHVRRLSPDARIHAFEPNPHTYARLAARFDGDARAWVHNIGLGDKQGLMVLYEPAPRPGSTVASFYPDVFRNSGELARHTVAVETLDNVVAAHGIDRITYLKLDVEGFEGAVLDGARDTIGRGMVDLIHLEMNHHNCIAGLNIYKLTALLPDYSIYKILPNGLYPMVSPQSPYHERIESYRLINLACIRNASPLHTALVRAH